VLKFAPKEKSQTKIAPLDDAGQAIVAQIRTAAGLAKDDCDLEIPFPGNGGPRRQGLEFRVGLDLTLVGRATHQENNA
jgi:hypothetical protein